MVTLLIKSCSIWFLDSTRFMQESLDTLIKTVADSIYKTKCKRCMKCNNCWKCEEY